MGAIRFSIDRELLLFFKQRLSIPIFIETGTYQGDSLDVAADIFDDCRSIELSKELYEGAKNRFRNRSNVELYHGESAGILADICEEFSGCPLIFWLDAHWCVGNGAVGQDSQSPLLDELRAIGPLDSQSVMLIDDARLYLSPPPEPHRITDWPNFHDIVVSLISLSPDHRLMILNDVIIFYPERIESEMTSFARTHGVDWLVLANQSKKRTTRWKKRSLLRRLRLQKPNRSPDEI